MNNNTGKRLLLVDDDADSSRAMRALLERDGYRVSVAHRLDEALDCCDEFLPDVLVSDYSLPDGDGCELARRLRAKPAFRGLMIAVTGFVDRSSNTNLRSAGFDAWFAKPLDFPAFRDFLREASDGEDSSGRPVI